MRLSRVLLAGGAVAAAGIATSAFTASNTITVDDNVAGYDEAVVTGVAVSNIRYNPDADAAKLNNVVFTVGEDTTDMAATMTLYVDGTPDAVTASSGSSCLSAAAGSVYTITCTLTTPVELTAFDKVGLTVVSQ